MNDQEILEKLAQQAPPVRPGWAEHVLHVARRARRRRTLASLVGAVGAAVGISSVFVAVLPGLTAQPNGAAPAPAARAGDPATQPYAASITALARQMRGGQAGPWPVIYLLDHACSSVAERPVTAATCGAQALAGKLRHELAAALAAYAPAVFVANPAAVIGHGPCPTVIHGGLLVILGPVRISGTRAQVPISGQVGCLNGQGLTYRLVMRHGQWTIAGTTGATWIS